MKLRELIEEFDGNAFGFEDQGSGCAGEKWLDIVRVISTILFVG